MKIDPSIRDIDALLSFSKIGPERKKLLEKALISPIDEIFAAIMEELYKLKLPDTSILYSRSPEIIILLYSNSLAR